MSGLWTELGPPQAWDRRLAELGGHPLQSALWGEARQEVDGIQDLRLVFGETTMVRIEVRPLPFGGKVAWAPRGPVGPMDDAVEEALRTTLRGQGFALLVTDRWQRAEGQAARRPRTIWLDLSQGPEALMARLERQWRYGVGRAERKGVTVGLAQDDAEVARFFEMCLQVSRTKGFELPGSLALMTRLLAKGQSGDVEARLMVARYEGQIAAGAFLMRSGRSLHYFWGATDRVYAKHNVGQAVQWAAIEWGLERGCLRYDLEGVDPQGNPGVYAFKRAMGGEEVSLVGQAFAPLGLRGGLIGAALKARDVLRARR
jgi:hypothetical protein